MSMMRWSNGPVALLVAAAVASLNWSGVNPKLQVMVFPLRFGFEDKEHEPLSAPCTPELAMQKAIANADARRVIVMTQGFHGSHSLNIIAFLAIAIAFSSAVIFCSKSFCRCSDLETLMGSSSAN